MREKRRTKYHSIIAKIIWLSLLLSAFSNETFAQTLKGIITDSRTHEPLIGATIQARSNGKRIGNAATDANGQFLITHVKSPLNLEITEVGYRTEHIDIYEITDETVTINLTEDLNLMQGVVVVGYGTQKKSDITGSIASIPSVNIENTISPSLDAALSGTIAGVNVTQSSGQPGATSSIRIRGGNSITGGNEPLYVIDGLIMYNDNDAAGGLNALATINSGDIENIEVLKDASATAIYGSRGANGVIIITTKKGKEGKDQVSYRGSIGWQTVRKQISLLNGPQWMRLRNDIETNLGNSPTFTEEEIANAPTYDWQDAIFRTGIIQDHQISLNGGDQKTKYAISGNVFKEDGIVKNTGLERYTARINFSRKLNNKFNFGINAFGSHSKQSLSEIGVNGSATLRNLLAISPIVPIYDDNGNFNYENPYASTLVNGKAANKVSDILNTINDVNTNRSFGNIYGEYEVIKDLKAKINLGADLISSKNNYYAPSYTTGGMTSNGSASINSRTTNTWQAEFTLNYYKTIKNKHFLDLLAGYTAQRTDMEYAIAKANSFLNDYATYNSLQSGTASLPASGSYTNVLNSWLGRVNYSYLHRYNLTATLRADGSSRFSNNHKWGFFPSIGLSWNVNDEKFLRHNKTISMLKARFSAGATGNQEIGDYQFLSLLTPTNYSNGTSLITGFYPSTLENPDLKWEKTAQYDLGFDLGLLRNRISITLDLYYKRTTNLLLNVPIATSTGYSSVLENIGSVSNKGVELSINADILKKRRFTWNSNIVFAINKNKVLSLGGNMTQFSPLLDTYTQLQQAAPIIVKEGEPLGTFWGYVTDGIVQSGDDLTKVAKVSWANETPQPGYQKYVDQNGDGVINSKDRVVLGNTQPDFTYGWTNTLTYKGFDFSVLLQGSHGNKLYNGLRQQLEITSLTDNAYSTVLDRWSLTNATNVMPHATSSPVSVVNDYYVEDASYLRLKNLTLGYTFKFHKFAISTLRAYFSAQNVFTITNYTGYDPEISTYGQNSLFQGVDFGGYPASHSYTFGIEIKF